MSIKSNESDGDSDDEEFLTDRKSAKEWLTEEEDSIPSGPPRTKNELLFDDSLIYDPDSAVIQNGDNGGVEACDSLVVSASTGSAAFSAEELTLIGTIMCRMDEENTLVVQAAYTQSPLNEGSLLCFQEGIVLGKICEIFGPITSPFYVVKWATLPSAIPFKSTLSSKNKEDGSSAKKKKNKRGAGHSKAAKKEELASINENSLEQSEENSDILDENPIHEDENGNLDSLDPDALNQTLSADADADATDAMVITESAVVDQHVCEDSEQELLQPKTTTSAAQAEYFSVLMSRALPGTAVYSAAKHTVVITASSLSALRKQNKGTDASNLYDEEIADDEKEYSDDEEELLAKQERNRSKRTLDNSGKSKLINPTGGRSAYVPSTDSAPRMAAARPPHSAPSSNSNIHYQQQQQQQQQQQSHRNQGHSNIVRTTNHAPSSNSIHSQQSQQQGLIYSNQPPQQYQNRIEPPQGYPQQQQQQQQKQYSSQYPPHAHPQHGTYMTGNNQNLNLQGGYPSMGYNHQSQPPGPSYPSRVDNNGLIQADYHPNYGIQQPRNHQQMPQQYGMPPQHQQQQQPQQQPVYHFPSHIQALPQGQSPSAPWPGFGVPTNSSGNGASFGTGAGARPTATGQLPAYVHRPIQFNTKMP